jgi:cytochrome c556
MKHRILAAAAVTTAALIATAAMAQEEPQVVRQDMMEQVGEANGVMGRMVRGQRDYDAAAVLEALETIREVAITFPDHFPEGSESGYETEALPSIWENPDDFAQRSQKLADDAATLIAAAPQDLETFQPLFQQFAGNCRDCHTEYRQSDD